MRMPDTIKRCLEFLFLYDREIEIAEHKLEYPEYQLTKEEADILKRMHNILI